MSFIINPNINRLGYSKYWNNVWCLSKNINYSFLVFSDESIIVYLAKILNKTWLRKQSFILSNIRIFRRTKKLNIFISIRFQLFVYKEIFFRNLIETHRNNILNTQVLYNQQNIVKKYFRIEKASMLLIIRFLKTFLSFDENKYKYQYQRKFYYKCLKILYLYCLYYNSYMKNCWFIKRIVSRNIQQDIWQYCVWTYLECFFVFWKYSLFSTQYIISILKNFSHFSEILSVYFIYIPVSKLTSRFLTNFIKHKLNQHYPIKSIIYRLLANISTGFEINNFNGIKICVSGRFTRKERKLFYWKSYKKIGYSDINTKLDYNLTTIILKNSICGIKVWSNQGVKLNNLFIF